MSQVSSASIGRYRTCRRDDRLGPDELLEPRSSEGWRLARPVRQNTTVEARMDVRAGLHPSPERGGGTARWAMGGDAGRFATNFEMLATARHSPANPGTR